MARLGAERGPGRKWFSGRQLGSKRWSGSAWPVLLLVFMVSLNFGYWPRFFDLPYELHFAVLVIMGAVTLFYLRPAHFRSWLAGLFSVHLVFVVASVLVARDDWLIGVLGNQSRYDGLLYHAAIVVVAIVGFNFFRRWPRLIDIALKFYFGAAVFQSLLIVLQRTGVKAVSWILLDSDMTMPPVGTIGNAGFAAGFILPAVVLLFVEVSAGSSQRNRLWALAALSLTAIGLALTDNKASFYALIFVLFGVVVVRFRVRTVVLAAVTVAIIFTGRGLVPDLFGVQESLNPQRSASGRILIWRAALEAVVHTPGQPVVGGGPDAFELAQYREQVDPKTLIPFYHVCCWSEFYQEGDNPEFVGVESRYQEHQDLRGKVFAYELRKADGSLFVINQTPVVDKAHNLYLDTLLSYGVFSALAWLAIYLVPIAKFWRSRAPLPFALAWALIGLQIYFLVWFTAISVEPFFVILVAAAWALMPQKRVDVLPPTQTNPTGSAVPSDRANNS